MSIISGTLDLRADYTGVGIGNSQRDTEALLNAIELCGPYTALHIPQGVYTFERSIVINKHMTITSAPTAQMNWMAVTGNAAITIDFSNFTNNTGSFHLPCLYYRPGEDTRVNNKWDISKRKYYAVEVIEADVIDLYVHYAMFWNRAFYLNSRSKTLQNLYLRFNVLDNNNVGIECHADKGGALSESQIIGTTIGVCKAGIKFSGEGLITHNHFNIRSIWPYDKTRAIEGLPPNNIVHPTPLIQTNPG